MWRNSGLLYLPCISRRHKRVYKPTVDVTTKLVEMSSFCYNRVPAYRDAAGVYPSNIYVSVKNVPSKFDCLTDKISVTV